MSSEKIFTKDELDLYLKEVSKVFRKLNGKTMPAEIIMIGGAAILVNYGFRDMTTNIDAIIHASSAMKDAINQVTDEYNLPNGWLNSDFMNTDSYTPKLTNYSKYYRTFSNVVEVRTVSAEYLVAMKLKAGRKYKHDLSDIVGILAEHEKRGDPISLEAIKTAVENLYGSWDCISDFMKSFIDDIYKTKDFEKLYESVRQEAQNKENLIEFQHNYPGVTNTQNVDDIIASIKKKKSLNQQIKEAQPQNIN